MTKISPLVSPQPYDGGNDLSDNQGHDASARMRPLILLSPTASNDQQTRSPFARIADKTHGVIWLRHPRGYWGCAAWDGPAGRRTCHKGCRWRCIVTRGGRIRTWSAEWETIAICTHVHTLRIEIAVHRRRQSRGTPSRCWLQAYREAPFTHHMASVYIRAHARRIPLLPWSYSLLNLSECVNDNNTHVHAQKDRSITKVLQGRCDFLAIS